MMAPPTLQPTQTLPPMTAPMASMMLNYQQPPAMPATSAATYQPVRFPQTRARIQELKPQKEVQT